VDLEDVDHVPRRGEAASHSVPPLKSMTRDASPVGHTHTAWIAWISSAHLSSTSLGTGSAGPRGSNPDGEGTTRNTVWRSALLFTVRQVPSTAPNKENHRVRIHGPVHALDRRH